MANPRRKWATAILVAYLAGVVYLTLFLKFSLGVGVPVNLIPFAMIVHDIGAGGRDFVVNFLGNLGIFAPVGFLLPNSLGSRSTALRVGLIALGLSLAIEFSQFLSGSRVADIDDVILNTSGALIGYATWALGRRILGMDADDASVQKA